jgi:hypothetical protein
MTVSLFINDSEEITVLLFVAPAKKGNFVFCDIDKEMLVKTGAEDIDAEKIEQHQVTFRMPSYGDNNRILDSGVRLTEDSLNVSPHQIRLERICTLIKDWTFKDAKGDAVRVTRDAVKKLHPTVALTLGIALENDLRERGML